MGAVAALIGVIFLVAVIVAVIFAVKYGWLNKKGETHSDCKGNYYCQEAEGDETRRCKKLPDCTDDECPAGKCNKDGKCEHTCTSDDDCEGDDVCNENRTCSVSSGTLAQMEQIDEEPEPREANWLSDE